MSARSARRERRALRMAADAYIKKLFHELQKWTLLERLRLAYRILRLK